MGMIAGSRTHDVIGCDVIGCDVIGCDVIGRDVIGGAVPKE